MHCPSCGRLMESLPKLYLHSGKAWYGCPACNKVVEKNFCSLTGRDLGTTPCFYNYTDYLVAIARKNKE